MSCAVSGKKVGHSPGTLYKSRFSSLKGRGDCARWSTSTKNGGKWDRGIQKVIRKWRAFAEQFITVA